MGTLSRADRGDGGSSALGIMRAVGLCCNATICWTMRRIDVVRTVVIVGANYAVVKSGGEIIRNKRSAKDSSMLLFHSRLLSIIAQVIECAKWENCGP